MVRRPVLTTWILLRGLGREQAHWGVFPQELRERLASADTLVMLDLPGNGRHWREASPLAVTRMVDAARSELQQRRCRPPYALVALSLGGMVALEWAATHGAEVRACALVNTSLRDFSPFWERLRPSAWAALLPWLLPGSPQRRERAVLQATSNRVHDASVLDEWADIAARHPVSRANVLRQLLAAARFRAPGSMPAPTLVVVSRGDRLVVPACSEAIARAWQLPLHEHPWAGHDLPLDDPSWLADRIARWAAKGFA